jgi:hypothetical protein
MIVQKILSHISYRTLKTMSLPLHILILIYITITSTKISSDKPFSRS